MRSDLEQWARAHRRRKLREMNRKHKMTIGVTLPPAPAVGQYVHLMRQPDERLVISSDELIMGLAENLIVDIGSDAQLVFTGSKHGWLIAGAGLGVIQHDRSIGSSAQVHAGAGSGDGAEGAAGAAGGVPQGS